VVKDMRQLSIILQVRSSGLWNAKGAVNETAKSMETLKKKWISY
jgi:hypothetical protein